MSSNVKMILIISLCLIVLTCRSQLVERFDPARYEKVRKALKDTTMDERARLLNDLAFMCVIDLGSECLHYAWTARDISIRLGNETELGRALYNLGLYEHYHGTYTKALLYYHDAVKIFERLGMYEMEGNVHVHEIMAYFGAGQITAALKKVMNDDALICYRKAGSLEKQAIYLYGKGFFYNNYLNDYRKSIDLHLEALNICDSFDASTLLTGGINAATGYAYSLYGDEDSAFFYTYRSMNTLDTSRLEDRLMKIQVTRELGSTYKRFGHPDSSIYYLERARNESETFGYIFGIAWSDKILGEIAMDQGKLYDAITFLQEAKRYLEQVVNTGNYFAEPEMRGEHGYAWDIASRMSDKDRVINAIKSLRGTLEVMSMVFLEVGDYESALDTKLELEVIRDSIYRWEQDREMKELLARYESEQKENEIISMKQEAQLKALRIKNARTSVIGLGAGLMILIFIGFLVLKQRRIKEEQKIWHLEQKLLINQMNPHFIFNALTNIQGYMFLNEKKKAGLYLDIFSELIRDTLRLSNLREVSLRKDITLIDNYLALQRLRYGEKLQYSIHVDDSIDQEGVLVPPSLIQPFVENAVEHGIKFMKGKGMVEIVIKKRPDQILCSIRDNGVGCAKAREIEEKRGRKDKGMGITITTERLSALKGKSGRQGKINIRDLYDENGRAAGTLVLVYIPCKTRRY